MAKKDQNSSSTVTPDMGTQQWQRYVRGLLQGVAGGVLGPDGIGMPDYDKQLEQLKGTFADQRTAAGMAANDLATKAGAFGGDRAAILQSQALRDVNKDEARAVTNLGITQNNTQWDRILQTLGALQGGFTGGGSTTSNTVSGGSPLGALAGGLGIFGGLGGFGALDKAAFDIFGGV